ncbi:MAG TPA: triose-phosphate isomerase [Moraxellaceae bacterium]|nr:triose-phosphate isomerase [Moraxellaceae bacterium]
MRRKLVAGNWKMNGRLAINQSLVESVLAGVRGAQGVDVWLAPPAVYLPQVAGLLNGSVVGLAAQNASREQDGAFTGEVSADMLADVGCHAVLVGHSERRSLYGESDAVVVEKFKRIQAAGLVPVLCVGETLAEREAGCTESVVLRQLGAVIDACGVESLVRSVVAYEPVWAIGTGRTATPGQAQQVHAVLRGDVARRNATVAEGLRILYGGSVKAANAESLFAMADIDGALVGGASLVAEEFVAIARAAEASR